VDFMKLRQRLALAVVALPLVLVSSGTRASSPDWQISGSLSEACSCAVPCRCNFGGLPSPHRFCYSMYSYKIKQGRYEDTTLDGFKFGSVDARFGRTVYIDQDANPAQRAALLSIAVSVLGLKSSDRFYEGQSMSHIATGYVNIVQEHDDHGNRLKLGEDGEFRADYIIGRDGKTPVTVRNNTTWDIPVAIKGTTSTFTYRLGRNRFSFTDTNSNQGDFNFSSQPRNEARRLTSCHKEELVNAPCPRNRAHLPRTTSLRWSKGLFWICRECAETCTYGKPRNCFAEISVISKQLNFDGSASASTRSTALRTALSPR